MVEGINDVSPKRKSKRSHSNIKKLQADYGDIDDELKNCVMISLGAIILYC